MPFICNLIGFIPAAVLSVRAFGASASASAEERTFQKKNWMAYWVIFGAFGVAETFNGAILFFMPFYYSFKV